MTRDEAIQRAKDLLGRYVVDFTTGHPAPGDSMIERTANALLQAQREALEEAIRVTNYVAMLVDDTSSQSGIIAAISTGIHALIKKDAEND